jgi:hypothetical protein
MAERLATVFSPTTQSARAEINPSAFRGLVVTEALSVTIGRQVNFPLSAEGSPLKSD